MMVPTSTLLESHTPILFLLDFPSRPNGALVLTRSIAREIDRVVERGSRRAEITVMASSNVVGFVGLDELSLELASSLIRSGFRVQGFEVVGSSVIDRFLELGGAKCASPMEAARNATAMIIVASADEMTEVFFGKEGVVRGLCMEAVVILQSTLSPSHIQKLEKNLSVEAGNLVLVDAQIFQGVSEPLKGKNIVVTSGSQIAMRRARPVLSAISEKVFSYEGEVSVGRKIRMVNDLLEGIHLVALVEAIFLGVRAGIHPSILYDIISNAAGSSWIFVDTVPKLLSGDHLLTKSLSTLVKNVGFVLDMAKAVTFPLPLLVIAYQQLIQASSCTCGDFASASPWKIWEQMFGVNIRDAANQKSYNPGHLAEQLSVTSKGVKRIGFIGLGAMGFGMATHLLRSNFYIIAYDVYKPTLNRFADLGGIVGSSPEGVAKDVEVLIVMVANEAQAESVLYGNSGSVFALPAGATIILSSTVSPGFITRLEQRLKG